MFTNIFILACSLAVIMKGATLATKYAALLAESFHLSKYIVGFIVIAVISILPETFIAVNSALAGNPSFGLGTLFGSNIADLTLVFATIILLVGRGLKVEGKILKNRKLYPIFLFLPLVLGFDGFYSRSDGLALAIIGCIFYYLALKDGVDNKVAINGDHRIKNIFMLLFGMAMLMVGAIFTVSSASSLAYDLNVSSVLIGIMIVGVSTTIPEMFFALKSIKRNDDSLAIGDILGTVLADATIVVGLISMVSPFAFSRTIICVSGFFMICASIILYHCLHSGKKLSKQEAYFLFVFWVFFVLTEFFVNKFFN